jgi:hypothetical protein
VSNFMKRVFAGLQRAGKAPSSTTQGRRTCLAVENLEERLALSSAANLIGDVFLLQDPAGKAVGQLTISQENQHTGEFGGTFLDTTGSNHMGTINAVGGRIGRLNHKHASIVFAGSGALGTPGATGEIQGAQLTGSVKGQRHQASLSGSLDVQDLFWVVGVLRASTNVHTQVTAHA